MGRPWSYNRINQKSYTRVINGSSKLHWASLWIYTRVTQWISKLYWVKQWIFVRIKINSDIERLILISPFVNLPLCCCFNSFFVMLSTKPLMKMAPPGFHKRKTGPTIWKLISNFFLWNLPCVYMFWTIC